MEKSTFELIIELLGVVIWPLTLLVILFLFRKYFAAAISRLGSLEAGATGISMTFQEKIEEAQSLVKTINPDYSSKTSSLSINPVKGRLKAAEREFETKINETLLTNQLPLENKSIVEKSKALNDKGIINKDQLKLACVLDEVFRDKKEDVTENQVLEIERIVESFKI